MKKTGEAFMGFTAVANVMEALENKKLTVATLPGWLYHQKC